MSWPSSCRAQSTDELELAIGHFDGKGKLHNPTERTYTFPDIGVFAAYYPGTDSLSTGLSFELWDRSSRPGVFHWFKIDAQISEQRLGLAVGRKLIPVIDLTLSLVWSRDLRRDCQSWGLSLGLVKF